MPPFDRIRDSDYLPAFQAGMREQLSEVAASLTTRSPPPSTTPSSLSSAPGSC